VEDLGYDIIVSSGPGDLEVLRQCLVESGVVGVGEDFSLSLYCAEYAGTQVSVVLDWLGEGTLLWAPDVDTMSFDVFGQCLQVDPDLTINVDFARYIDDYYVFDLIPYINPADPEGFTGNWTWSLSPKIKGGRSLLHLSGPVLVHLERSIRTRTLWDNQTNGSGQGEKRTDFLPVAVAMSPNTLAIYLETRPDSLCISMTILLALIGRPNRYQCISSSRSIIIVFPFVAKISSRPLQNFFCFYGKVSPA